MHIYILVLPLSAEPFSIAYIQCHIKQVYKYKILDNNSITAIIIVTYNDYTVLIL